jgi:hypothetical protein
MRYLRYIHEMNAYMADSVSLHVSTRKPLTNFDETLHEHYAIGGYPIY